jgi:hypothetical protein
MPEVSFYFVGQATGEKEKGEVMPLKQFKCQLCGRFCPSKYLADSKFKERMAWLRRHRQEEHPKEFRRSIRKAVFTRRVKGAARKARKGR